MKMRGLVLALSLGVIALSAGKQDGCSRIPRGQFKVNGRCFLISFENHPENWAMSEKGCDAMGGKLASIRYQAEFEGLIQEMKHRGVEKVWTSLNSASGQWKWTSTGSTMHNNIWWGGSQVPSTSPTRCAFLCDPTRAIWSASCSQKHPALCEF